MIHWFVFNFMVLLVCLFVIIEKTFSASIGFLSPLAWILFIITLIIFIKDIFVLRGGG